MSKLVTGCALLSAAALCTSAYAGTTTINIDGSSASTPDLATLLATESLLPLSLAAYPGLSVTLDTPNSFSDTFANAPFYSGTLSVEVYGNQAVPGPSLDTVMLVYTFTSDAGGAQGLEAFEFGVNSSLDLDLAPLSPANGADHYRVEAGSTGSQANPDIDLFDNPGASPDTWLFNYAPNAEALGPGEQLTWAVVLEGADFAINAVNVRVTDLGFKDIQTLAPVLGSGQPNLPTPGAVGLLAVAGLAGSRRRR